MVSFAGQRSTSGFYAPTRFEADVFDCEVVGQIPSDLNGGFYRLHLDAFYPSKHADDAILAYDGYVSAFRFNNGIVDYKGRYVRTERFVKQLEARRQLYGYYRNPYTDDPSVADPEHPGLRTTANTTPVVHAGRLLATKEDGLPYAIDPNTLETLGPTDFGGRWKSQTFTAHPKIDPVTGEMVAFGYEASGLASKDIFLATFDKAGRITHEMRFDVPYVSMLHDICLTQKHVVIPGGGTITDMDRLKAGKSHWAWDSTLPSYYGIVPRDGDPKDVRWFKGPERALVHTVNAITIGDKVVMEAPVLEGNPWPWFHDVHGAPFKPREYTLRRFTFDLNSKDDGYTEEILFRTPITSFTRMDDRFLSLPYRYTYVQYSDPERPFNPALAGPLAGRIANSYARFDMATGTMASFYAGDSHAVQEPTFVPRPGSSEEGDGYLLGIGHNHIERRSELFIIDAQRMEEVARILLPFRSSNQVHGVWAGQSDLPLADPTVIALRG